MKKCTRCGEEIEDKASVCPYCNWYQPRVDKGKDKKFFTQGLILQGLILGTFLSLLSVLIAINNGVSDLRSDPSYIDDGWTGIIAIFNFSISFIIVIFAVWVLHGLLYLIQNRSTIDIPGSRWFLYGFEILLSLVIYKVILNYFYS